MNGFKFVRCEVINKTMEELAEMLSVSKQIIYMWESGRKSIPEKRLEELQGLFGIPKKYFLLQDVSEEDKLEMRKWYLQNEIECTTEWEEGEVRQADGTMKVVSRKVYVNADLLNQMSLNEFDMKMNQLLKKMKRVITPEVKDATYGVESALEKANARRQALDRFLDILENNSDQKLMERVMRSMEAFFEYKE